MSTYERIGNIDGAQRRLRRLNGLILGAAAIGFAAWGITSGISWPWLLLSLPLYLGAALGFLQAQAST